MAHLLPLRRCSKISKRVCGRGSLAAASPFFLCTNRQSMKRKAKVTDNERNHPFLRLRGKWLALAGFPVGTETLITVTNKQITITPK